jgi:hypothetical protein
MMIWKRIQHEENMQNKECVDALGSEAVTMWSGSEDIDVEKNGGEKSMQNHCA